MLKLLLWETYQHELHKKPRSGLWMTASQTLTILLLVFHLDDQLDYESEFLGTVSAAAVAGPMEAKNISAAAGIGSESSVSKEEKREWSFWTWRFQISINTARFGPMSTNDQGVSRAMALMGFQF